MSHSYSYDFPALRGIQAGHEYYVAMCPLKLLPRLFLFDEAAVPPELRAQRTLNKARIPEIVDYIITNQNDYAFSAITASIDGEIHFEPISEHSPEIGQLIVSMTARFVINDGQHRRAAIEKALEECPKIGDETIAVVFYRDEGLRRSQQLFADLNKHAVRPSRSQGILYDYRDPMSNLSQYLAENAALFKGRTEKEKTTISNRSSKLFTLHAIYQATSALLGRCRNEAVSECDKILALTFWDTLVSLIPEWQMAVVQEIYGWELRQNYIHAHAVALHAIGIAGNALITTCPETWQEELARLKELDWSRSNAQLWEGRAMSGGQMSKARQNVQLTANLLKITLGLPLTSKEEKLESKFLAGISK